MSPAEKAALVRIRNAYAEVKAEAEAVRPALLPQVRELDDPAVWLSREAARVRQDLHTVSLGVRNRIDEAQEMIDHIDLSLRSAS